ncbi:MAG: putative Ig domain-containing protein [Blastocatellia bacterium]|nr:putative Ig domain-containing protein [Blastocatellia bacterium]
MLRLTRFWLLLTVVMVAGLIWFGTPNSSAFWRNSGTGFAGAARLKAGFTNPAKPMDLKSSTDGIWQEVDETLMLARTSQTAVRNVKPQAYRTLQLNPEALQAALSRAPMEFTAAEKTAPLVLTLPMADGKFARFRVVESPIMEPGLQVKYPRMKTYSGQGIDDPTAIVRFDVVPQGFHAMILSGSGTTYIDPYWKNDTSLYASYRKRDYRDETKRFECLVEGNPDSEGGTNAALNVAPKVPTGANLRIYRTAVATTGEYTTAAGGSTVEGGLGAVITTVNRVSGMYERELAIRLMLVANNDLIIYTNSATDPYTNNNASSLLTENQNNLTTVIGTANFDIGHVFSTGGGGLAGLGVVCQATQKARGETGLGNPVGDPYDIDYVAHEMGHQFGGNHPFNGTTGSCSGGNRNASTAYEVGSGNTIQAYAGICNPQDLQPNSDDYFHTISYQEIDTYTSTGSGNCRAPGTPTGNTPPMVGALTNFTIPQNTPFTLTATATDPDVGDVLTYCWEEFDLGAAQDPTAAPRDNGSSPIFRSYDPTTSPSRTFPRLDYILNNANVPPALISLPGVGGGAIWASGEFLPITSRTMTFRVTVRDNRVNGGGVNRGSMTVTTNPSVATAFAVTAPNTAVSLTAGSATTVTWQVASTTAAPVSTANVNILLSTDGGYTFPTTLAANTPNDGTQSVTIPAGTASTQARIKVEAVGNIFFDICDTNFTITAANNAPTISGIGSITFRRGSPAVVANVATVSDGLEDPAGTLAVSVSGAPFEMTLTASNTGGTVSFTASSDCTLVTNNTSKTYPVILTVTDSAGAKSTATVNVVVQPNLSPTLGTYTNPASIAPGASVNVTPSAAPADANNAIGGATALPSTLPGGGTVTVNPTTGVVTVNTTGATANATYTIRVSVTDICGASAVLRSFQVTVSGPTRIINAAGSTITAGTCGTPAFTTAVDPGETVTVDFGLNNTGTANTTSLVATLQSSGGITPITTSQNYGVVVAGGATVTRSFQFTANGTCGSTATATFQLQDGALNLGTATFNFLLGGGATSTIFSQNFDGVTAPALPAGWTAARFGTTPPAFFATTATTPDTAPNAAFTNGSTTAATNSLISPAIALPAGPLGATVSFRHTLNFEDATNRFDGAILELSTDGGTNFNNVTSGAVGGTFTAGGYTGTIQSGFSNPLAGQSSWGGVQAAYGTVTLSLPASLNGQSIMLRWRAGWDSTTANANPNWRIDGVTVSVPTCPNCVVCPTITVNPTTLANGTVGTAYSQNLTGSGGTGPYSFTVSAGTLPNGLTLSTGGVLSGNPTLSSSFNFTVQAMDSNGCTGTRAYTVIIDKDVSPRATLTVGSNSYSAVPTPGYVGDYTINTTLMNTGAPIAGPMYFKISQLNSVPAGNPNRLKTADNGAGAVGDIQTVAGGLGTGASTPVTFVIGVATTRVPFQFYIDLYGVSATNPGNRPLGTYRFEVGGTTAGRLVESEPVLNFDDGSGTWQQAANTALIGGIGPQSSPVVAVHPKNTLQMAVAANDYTSRTVAVRLTGDGGSSWRTMALSRTLGGEQFYTAQEPVAAYSPGGELFVVYTLANLTDATNALVLVRDNDRLTFSAPRALALHAASEGTFACRPALTFDNAGQPVVAWESVVGATGLRTIRLARLVGTSVVTSNVRQGFVSQPTVAVTANGICVGWNEWDRATPTALGQLLTATSATGTGFGSPVTVALPNLGFGRTAVAMPEQEIGPNFHIKRDPSAKDGLVAVFTGMEDGLDVFAVRSENGGATWSSPVRINDVAKGDQFHPAFDISAKGALTVVFYDSRESLTGEEVQLFGSGSGDGGLSFTANLKLTAQAANCSRTNPLRDFTSNLGDRTGLGLRPDGSAVYVWTGTHSGSEDIYWSLLR